MRLPSVSVLSKLSSDVVESKLLQCLMCSISPTATLNIHSMMLYDLTNKTNTFRSVSRETISQAARNRDHATDYMPAFHSVLNYAIKRIVREEQGLAHLHFLDAGSGKGKVCFLAEEHAARIGMAESRRGSWKSVTGIELNGALASISRHNALKLGSGVTFIEGDILDYQEIEPSTVIFAFNPFDRRVMRAFERKIRKIPQVYFIYNNPVHRTVFSDWIVVSRRRSLIQNLRTIIYRSPAVPAAYARCREASRLSAS